MKMKRKQEIRSKGGKRRTTVERDRSEGGRQEEIIMGLPHEIIRLKNAQI